MDGWLQGRPRRSYSLDVVDWNGAEGGLTRQACDNTLECRRVLAFVLAAAQECSVISVGDVLRMLEAGRRPDWTVVGWWGEAEV